MFISCYVCSLRCSQLPEGADVLEEQTETYEQPRQCQDDLWTPQVDVGTLRRSPVPYWIGDSGVPVQNARYNAEALLLWVYVH